MKKLILLALTAVIMVGCNYTEITSIDKDTGLRIIDSCEYICNPVYGGYVYIHHNNCRFCNERRKQELKELIEQLKAL